MRGRGRGRGGRSARGRNLRRGGGSAVNTRVRGKKVTEVKNECEEEEGIVNIQEAIEACNDENSAPKIDLEADISKLEAPTFTTLARGPPEPMLRLRWDHRVNLIGEKVLNPMIHCCDKCLRPILVYGRMIPCKHVFCLSCSKKEDKVCPRCLVKVIRVEQTGLGTVFMCTHAGTRYGNAGCRRTYMSQRDLQAHINHRHLSASVRGMGGRPGGDSVPETHRPPPPSRPQGQRMVMSNDPRISDLHSRSPPPSFHSHRPPQPGINCPPPPQYQPPPLHQPPHQLPLQPPPHQSPHQPPPHQSPHQPPPHQSPHHQPSHQSSHQPPTHQPPPHPPPSHQPPHQQQPHQPPPHQPPPHQPPHQQPMPPRTNLITVQIQDSALDNYGHYQAPPPPQYGAPPPQQYVPPPQFYNPPQPTYPPPAYPPPPPPRPYQETYPPPQWHPPPPQANNNQQFYH